MERNTLERRRRIKKEEKKKRKERKLKINMKSKGGRNFRNKKHKKLEE